MYNNVHVLLVEDLAVIQRAVQNILNHFNIQLTCASNAIDALHYIERNHYDLILMDIGLPDMPGNMLTKRIRHLETSTQTHTPIIALTANQNEDDHKNYLDAGMEEVMIKPITIDKMRQVVKQYIPKLLH